MNKMTNAKDHFRQGVEQVEGSAKLYKIIIMFRTTPYHSGV